jgi:hypothetical protein
LYGSFLVLSQPLFCSDFEIGYVTSSFKYDFYNFNSNYDNYLLKINKYPFIMKNMEVEGVMEKTLTFFLKSAVILTGLAAGGLSKYGLPGQAAFSAMKNPEESCRSSWGCIRQRFLFFLHFTRLID